MSVASKYLTTTNNGLLSFALCQLKFPVKKKKKKKGNRNGVVQEVGAWLHP